MHISRLIIKNFRSIKSIDIELGDTTVLVGPNNAGKTAILDALRIALTRRWGQRGTGFTEHDIHLSNKYDDPKKSSGVSIEIHVEERNPGDWSDTQQQDLDDIAQLDPDTDKSSVVLRTEYVWNADNSSFEPKWQFLNAARLPLAGRSARRTNLERFFQYLPVFYLSALRDVKGEFSPRSQFWGRLLKSMEIPEALESRVLKVLDLVNTRLLQADSRLTKIAETLSGATRVASRDKNGGVDLRLVPLNSLDLLSKAEIILRNEEHLPWLPLHRHGQGVQSLSVIFLFQAFVEHLLSEIYGVDSVPILALEEPETHLHPQAARTLWMHIDDLPGQKIITTHSPYFVQHVPFRDLRIIQLTEEGTKVNWLQSSFSSPLPYSENLNLVVDKNSNLLEYDKAKELITVHGKLNKKWYRDLRGCYKSHENADEILDTLKKLRKKSLLFVDERDLSSLETFARRIRGEIFFARRWFFVEGQAEYLIVHSLARQLKYGLDEHGVALIDAQNNGNPATFAVLARALRIPWIAVFDGDSGGESYINSIISRDFDEEFVRKRCRLHSYGNLEDQLLAKNLESELREILHKLGISDARTEPSSAFRSHLNNYKVAYAVELSSRLQKNNDLINQMPEAFHKAIEDLKDLN